MRLNKISALLLVAGGLMFSSAAKAVCPLCVVAVSAGLGLSRWLGVDDVISSIWIGALLASLSIWTIVWLKKKNRSFKYDKIVIWAAYYLIVLGPLYYADIIGHPLNKIFGIDKILFGAIVGTIIFLLSLELHKFLKNRNHGKSFFTFQRIIVSAATLLIASIIIYFLLKWI